MIKSIIFFPFYTLFVIFYSLGSEAIFYNRQTNKDGQIGVGELAKEYYQIESILIENYRPMSGVKPQLVFSFAQNNRGVSDYGEILNPTINANNNQILFTSDHDQERSLFKTNGFFIDIKGKDYMQLSPYHSNGRWQDKTAETGRVIEPYSCK